MLSETRAVLAGFSLSLVACSGSLGGPARPATISFGIDTLRLARGDSQSVSVKLLDANHHEIVGPKVSLTSVDGDANLAVHNGVVTGTSLGKATLVATIGKLTANLPVLVFGHPAGTPIERVSLGARPYGVAVGNNIALVTQLDAGTVTRLSLHPFQVTATIRAGQTPTGISINGTSQLALVANQYDPSVSLLDLTVEVPIATFQTGSTTFRTIFSSSGTRAYATLTEGLMLVLDPAERRIIDTIAVVPDGNGISLAHGDSLVYLSSMTGGISIVNTKTNAVISNLPFSGVLQEIVPSSDGTSLFVANESSLGIAVLSAKTGTLMTTIPLGSTSFGMALTPDGKQLWVTQPSGNVSIIDVAPLAVVRTLAVGKRPRRIAFDRFGSLAIVSDEAGAVIMIH